MRLIVPHRVKRSGLPVLLLLLASALSLQAESLNPPELAQGIQAYQ